MSMILGLLLTPFAQQPLPGDSWSGFVLRERSGAVYEWKPGRVLVVSIVAYWCDTWKPHLRSVGAAAASLKGGAVDFLVVSTDGRWTDLAPEAKWGRLVDDPGGAWTRSLGIDRIPTTIVVDPDGTVQMVRHGVLRPAEITQAMREKPTGNGKLYLTFDDFPSGRSDEDLLDLLRKLEVSATFFCIGENAVSHPKLIQRAHIEGHSLQMHGWSHDRDRADPARLSRLLAELTGISPKYLRLPGTRSISGLSPQPPTVDTFDYQYPPASEIVRRTILALKPGAILQMHAGVEPTREALPSIIERALKLGYQFEILR